MGHHLTTSMCHQLTTQKQQRMKRHSTFVVLHCTARGKTIIDEDAMWVPNFGTWDKRLVKLAQKEGVCKGVQMG